MITAFTPEQEEMIGVIREKWMGYGLSTQPANHEETEAALTKLYASMELPHPIVIWGNSPANTVWLTWFASQLTSQLTSQLASQLDSQLYSQLYSQLTRQLDRQLDRQLASQLASQLDSQLTRQLYRQLTSQLTSQLYSQLTSQLYSQLASQLYSQLYSQLTRQLTSQLTRQLASQLTSQLASQLDRQLYSQLYSQLTRQLDSQLDRQLARQLDSQLARQLDRQLDSQLARQLTSQLYSRFSWLWRVYWLGLYDFAKTALRFDLPHHDLFEAAETLFRNTYWMIPYSGICFISERHTAIHRDPKGRLHCENDMALAYSDGWGIYSWHGLIVDEEFIKKPMTFDQIMQERNAEKKRIMIERWGEGQFVDALGVAPVDVSEWGKLYRVEYGDSEPLVMVRVVDPSTDRVYFNQVPPKDDNGQPMLRAKQAIAWRFGLSEDDYLPLAEA